MDTAYMGGIVVLIDMHTWLMNMVGTTMKNCTSADTKDEKGKIKKNS